MAPRSIPAEARQQIIIEEREALRAEIVRSLTHTLHNGDMRQLRAETSNTRLAVGSWLLAVREATRLLTEVEAP